MMKFIIIAITLIIIASIGIFIFLQNKDTGEVHNDITNKATVEYFENQLEQGVLERIGQPVEGVDAFILISAFPKLIADDFEGVKSLEGIYSVKNGELEYTRTQGQPATSAEQTIAEDSYGLLLSNVSARLGIPPETTQSVDQILQEIADPKNGSDISTMGGIAGSILLGPQCPVMQFPPQESCNDKTYQTTVHIQEEGESEVLTVEADEQGRFVVDVPQGTYNVEAVGGNPFPRCASQSISVLANEIAIVTLLCDTGIR